METTTHLIQGMTCAHCEHAVGTGIRGIDGVVSADVDLAAGAVRVAAEHEVADAEIAEAVAEAGYTYGGRA